MAVDSYVVKGGGKRALNIFLPLGYDSSIESEVTDMLRVAVLGACTVALPLTDDIIEDEQGLLDSCSAEIPWCVFAPT